MVSQRAAVGGSSALKCNEQWNHNIYFIFSITLYCRYIPWKNFPYVHSIVWGVDCTVELSALRDRDPALCPPELAHEMFEIQNTIVIFAQDFISN